MKKHASKLVVRKEHLRTLDRLDLKQAAGGDPASALCPTHRFCTLANC